MTIQRFPFSENQNNEWNSFIDKIRRELHDHGVKDGNGYHFVRRNELPQTPFDGLIDKDVEPLILVSGYQDGAFVSLNVHRVDEQDSAVDQNPCGILVLPSGNTSIATVIHHGDWPNRTVKGLNQLELKYIQSSGIINQFQFPGTPPDLMGPLNDLPGNQRRAFEEATNVLKEIVEGENNAAT